MDFDRLQGVTVGQIVRNEEMTMEWNGSVGERLLQLRNEKGMTQEDLAEYLNVSRQSVSKWELNKTLPDVEKLMQLSELYEVTLDYLVKGVEPVDSRKNQVDNSAAQEVNSAEQSDLNKDSEGTAKEQQESPEDVTEQMADGVHGATLEMTVHRIVFLLAMIVSGILCICTFVFSIGLVNRHTFSLDDKQQEVVYVDQIYEQYTLADVLVTDEDWNYHREKVWLDVSGVREGDYIGYYYREGESEQALFKYYIKTLILPFVVAILLLIFTIVFLMGFQSYGGKRNGKKN